MKNKQFIFVALLIVLCNYFAYYFGSQMPEYYTQPSDLRIVMPGFIFIMASICADLYLIVFYGVEFYYFLGKKSYNRN